MSNTQIIVIVAIAVAIATALLVGMRSGPRVTTIEHRREESDQRKDRDDA
jgi:hypothetical protein